MRLLDFSPFPTVEPDHCADPGLSTLWASLPRRAPRVFASGLVVCAEVHPLRLAPSLIGVSLAKDVCFDGVAEWAVTATHSSEFLLNHRIARIHQYHLKQPEHWNRTVVRGSSYVIRPSWLLQGFDFVVHPEGWRSGNRHGKGPCMGVSCPIIFPPRSPTTTFNLTPCWHGGHT